MGQMQSSLFQHSIFGAITFLVLSHSDLYKFVSKLIQVKDKNMLMVLHAIVFAIVMYLGSLFILQPLLTEGGQWNGQDCTAGCCSDSDCQDCPAETVCPVRKGELCVNSYPNSLPDDYEPTTTTRSGSRGDGRINYLGPDDGDDGKTCPAEYPVCADLYPSAASTLVDPEYSGRRCLKKAGDAGDECRDDWECMSMSCTAYWTNLDDKTCN